MSNLPVLSLLETRVVGVLVEKQHTVPDTYPLTLNSLVSGCNQKTSRDPVIEATEAEVQAVVDRLRALSLVVESSGGRVMRYAHNAGKVLNVPGQSVAILAVLFLRGPQTPGELRINSERLHKFGDISAVEGFLDELAERGFVRQLARQPGSREARWAHLLSGESAIPAAATVEFPQTARDGDALTAGELAAIKANVDHLQAEVASLKETVGRLCKELGLPPLS
jgi:uncharacterized protein YceH (UPF0502 family)